MARPRCTCDTYGVASCETCGPIAMERRRAKREAEATRYNQLLAQIDAVTVQFTPIGLPQPITTDHLFPAEPPSHSGWVRGCRCHGVGNVMGCADIRAAYNAQWMRENRRAKRTAAVERAAAGVHAKATR